jgi:hypothetical protein
VRSQATKSAQTLGESSTWCGLVNQNAPVAALSCQSCHRPWMQTRGHTTEQGRTFNAGGIVSYVAWADPGYGGAVYQLIRSNIDASMIEVLQRSPPLRSDGPPYDPTGSHHVQEVSLTGVA